MSEPRLAPVPVAEWAPETRERLLAHLQRPELYLSGAPDAPPMPKVLGLFAHHVALGDGWMTFNDELAAGSVLDARVRELAILRVAWLTRNDYEWLQHIRIGTRAGLTSAQLHAVAEGPAAEVWSPGERAVVSTVDQLLADHTVDDATWTALGAHFDDAARLELLFTAGAYLALALVMNAVGMQPDPPTEVIDAPAPPGGTRIPG